jgi:hypothetical protein
MYTEQESPWKIWQLDWEALPPARERERKIRDMTKLSFNCQQLSGKEAP